MIRNRRHITFIAGLWLWATIWPVVSIPLHFKLVEHHACHWQNENKGTSLNQAYAKCPVCDFQFFWRDTPREQIILKRTDITICVINEHPASLHILQWHFTLLLRGPPNLA